MLTSLLLLTLLSPVQSKPDTVRARVLATIGESSATPFLLGEISGIAIDDSGRVYIADFQDPRIVVFSSRGRHLATIGRKGQGPGEFTAPTGPVIGPDGVLYVRNMEQVVRFTRDPRTGIASRFDKTYVGPTMAPWRSKLSSALDRQGRFHFPLEVGRPDGLTHYAYQRYGRDGRKLDSIPVPLYPTTRSSWASVPISEGSGRVVKGLSMVPFHPVPVWTVTSRGTMLSGPADRYELIETDSVGRTIRTIKRAVPADRIPPAVRADSLRALRSRIDSLPVSLSQVRGASDEVKSQRLPETYPFLRGVLVTPADEVWVRRWTPPAMGKVTVVDVFAAGGAYARTVIIPADCAAAPGIAVRGRVIACMVVDEETGAESVVVAQLGS
jgi:DNA-binding beta-propeller fold protein YncE